MVKHLALLMAMIFPLTGCGCAYDNTVKGETVVGSDKYDPDQELYEYRKVLSDGRTILCIVYSNTYAGGVSCDWGNTR